MAASRPPSLSFPPYQASSKFPRSATVRSVLSAHLFMTLYNEVIKVIQGCMWLLPHHTLSMGPLWFASTGLLKKTCLLGPDKCICLLDVIAADLNVFLLADAVIGISCAVLVLLYIFQRLGTSKLGVAFAPVILLWFFSNFCVGIYNIVTWYPGAPSPSPSSYQLHPALQHECFPAFCVNTLTGPACD